MDKIKLHNMEFFAHHGYYDEEQKIGNKYAVSITLFLDLKTSGSSDRLSDTVSYEDVYKTVRSVMSKPTRLLETIAESISNQLFQTYVLLHTCEISVSKFNPPIGGICEKSEIVIERSRF